MLLQPCSDLIERVVPIENREDEGFYPLPQEIT
jgi:hypothetical protein